MSNLLITSGDGSQESRECARLLADMYVHWARRIGQESEIISEETRPNMRARIFMSVRDLGDLRREAGVHRFVRIAPSDLQRRRHTSFVTVTVADAEESEEQIRSYIFQPYQLAVDHRTGMRTPHLESVMLGNVHLLWGTPEDES